MQPLRLLAVVSLVVVELLALAGARAHAGSPDVEEPVHAGRPLAAWVDALAAPDVEGRRAAAFACWALRRDLVPHAAAVAPACADDDPYVRTTVAKALESLGFRAGAAFPRLLRAYADAPPDRREALASACRAALPRDLGAAEVALVTPWLGDADPARRTFARTVLSAAGRTAGPAAAQALATALAGASDAANPDAAEVDGLRGTLAAVDPVASLGSDDREQRLAALRVLNVGPFAFESDVVTAVVTLLSDPEDDVRAGAVVVTSRVLLGRDQAVRAIAFPAVVAAWRDAPRGEARRFLPVCLARAAKDHPPALAAFREALTSTDSDVVTETFRAARDFDPVPDDVAVLALRALRTAGSIEQRRAASYLLEVASPGLREQVIPALAVACFEDDPGLRRAAGTALAAQGRPDTAVAAVVRAAIEMHRDVPTESGGLAALRFVGTGSREDVVLARELAAEGLLPAIRFAAQELVLWWDWASAEHERAVLAVACLADDPSERAQAWAVVRALAERKAPTGAWAKTLAPADASPRRALRHALVRCLAGDPPPDVVVRIAELLATVPDFATADEIEAEPVLEPLLGSPRPQVREAAARAFRHLGFSAELGAAPLARLAAADPDAAVRATAAGTVALLRRRGMTVPDATGRAK